MIKTMKAIVFATNLNAVSPDLAVTGMSNSASYIYFF